MIDQIIFVFVFCICFLLLIYGLPYRHNPLIGIAVLAFFLFLLYGSEKSSLYTTMIRYLRFTALYFIWAAIFLRIHIRYALFLAVSYQIFMGIWISCTQVIFYTMHISDRLLLMVSTGLLRIITIVIIRFLFLKPSSSRNPTLDEMAVSLFPAVACFISNLVLFDGLNMPAMQAEYQWGLPALVIFFAFSAILILVNSERFFETSRCKAEFEKANLQLKAQYQLLLNEQENTHRLHALHHDMRGHLETMRALANTNRVNDYIQQIEDNITQLSQDFFTGDPTLDALLNMKHAECIKHNIQLDSYIHLTHQDYLPSAELCALFFNCIDNAIEAIVNDQPNQRYIHLTGGEVNDNMVIRIENPYTHTLHRDGTIFATTKKDQNHHGFGLANIQEIVKRRNGTLTLQTDNNKFIVTWCIPHP